MKGRPILNVPLLHPNWKKLGYLFIPLPIFLVLGISYANPNMDPDEASQLLYGFWAIGFGILNLTREKEENEMIQSFRQQAFQTGFYWLIVGLAMLMLVNYLRFDRFTSNFFTAYLVLFLLNLYIYGAFQYQNYISSKSKK
jgi:hypothetical protein